MSILIAFVLAQLESDAGGFVILAGFGLGIVFTLLTWGKIRRFGLSGISF